MRAQDFKWLFVVPFLAMSTLSAAVDESSLAVAVKQGDRSAVRTLLQQRANVNASDVEGTTPLHWAVQRDDVELVDALIRAGADVRVATRYGVTPLSGAATNGNAAIIERLLKAGADPNTALPSGETVLMTASRTGTLDAVKVLLSHGADPNGRESSSGQTALMWAAAEGNAVAVRALIEAGADIHAESGGEAKSVTKVAYKLGITPQRKAELEQEKKINRSTTVESKDRNRLSFTPLLFAVRAGHVDVVKGLLDAGADVNETLPSGMSALVLAIANAHYELAAVLLDRGADPNADAHGWTPLVQLVRTRRLPTVPAPGPVPTGNLSSLELARKLIARGANINARMTREFGDGYRNRLRHIGVTPFLLAAKNSDVEMMQFLLDHGADPLAKTANEATAMILAAGVGMYNPGEDPGTAPEDEPQALEAIKLCLAAGIDVNAADKNGETALHGAAYRGGNSLVQLLVEKGATLDVKNTSGQTPLGIADGAFYSEFIHQQRHTAALLREILSERSMPVPEPPTVEDLRAQANAPQAY